MRQETWGLVWMNPLPGDLVQTLTSFCSLRPCLDRDLQSSLGGSYQIRDAQHSATESGEPGYPGYPRGQEVRGCLPSSLFTAVSHHPQLILANDSISTKGTKSGTFVMYNCARLATLFESYKRNMEQGLYPAFPPVSNLDFSLLHDEVSDPRGLLEQPRDLAQPRGWCLSILLPNRVSGCCSSTVSSPSQTCCARQRPWSAQPQTSPSRCAQRR